MLASRPVVASNARKAGISGPCSHLLGSLAERWNRWLGREGSNLRMAESKSAKFSSKINEPSEFSSSVHPLTAFRNFLRSERRRSPSASCCAAAQANLGRLIISLAIA
jgi:hypothetical protein